jgi:hypothetical protein
VHVNERFPLLYRRFPVCSFFEPQNPVGRAVYAVLVRF